MIKLALVDPDPHFAEEFEHMLDERSDIVIVAVSLDLNRALIVADKFKPQVMIIGPGVGTEASMSFIRELTSDYPIGCVLLSFNPTDKLRTAAIRANVVEVIRIPTEPDRIITAIQMAAGYAQQLVVKEDLPPSERKCTIITVFSTKGGVGKTVLATNIATCITRRTGSKVVLMDLDLQFGDVGIALGLGPDKTILEFAERIGNGAQISTEEVDEMLVTHHSGLKLLMAPKEPESADLITGERVSSILSILKRYADFIIVDTPASFNDTVLAVLDESNEISIVLTMDMLSVKNIKLGIKTLSELKYAREKQKLLINRVESNIGLKIGEIEKVLGMRSIAKTPFDKAITLSINKGVPVIIDAPKLPVSREIEDLAMFYLSKYGSDWTDIMAG